MHLVFGFLRKVAATCGILFLLQGDAGAQTYDESVKRCLADFGGIAWQLPYRPILSVRSCTSPKASYSASPQPGSNLRKLELIGELDLHAERPWVSGAVDYAALQDAVYSHFDTLFRRSGYQRMDATRAVDESSTAEPTPPYVKQARYTRSDPAGEMTLTYTTGYRNTWVITLDGPPTGTKP